jgi:hypothetical protein
MINLKFIWLTLGFNGFMGILTNCTKEIKANFSKFDVCVSSDHEDCRLRGYDPVWPGINLLTCRRKVKGKGKAIPLQAWTGP